MKQSIRKRLIHEIFESKEYQKEVNKSVIDLKKEAKTAPNEKTIETRFDQFLSLIFDHFLDALGFTYRPIKEQAVNTIRSVNKGHADTSFGNVIIEFKQPRTLSSQAQKENALNQAIAYIKGFNKSSMIKTYGVVTDGYLIATNRYEQGHFVTSDYHEIQFIDLHNIIKALMGLEYKVLSSENLVDDFAKSDNSPAKKLARSLLNTLLNSKTNKTKMLISEWMNLFKLSHTDKSKQLDIQKRKKALENAFSVKLDSIDKEYDALFALQTSYTILLKLLSFKIISQTKYESYSDNFSSLLTSSNEMLQIEMKRLEDGSIIRDYGISNLLEGDYFSWYAATEQWTDEIANAIKNMLGLLDSYSNNNSLSKTSKAQDFFKVLYQSMIPAEVRHSLGEYYTPHWLAEDVIDKCFQFNKKANWRALDPSCGSGTFLTVLINKFISDHKYLEKTELLSKVTKSIVGIDINPLAVLTARVNYFLNISSLLTDDVEVEIPVYSGDSAYTPQIVEKDGVQFVKYSLNTNLFPFDVFFPLSGLKNLKKFSRTMNEIEIDIQTKNTDSVFQRLLELVNIHERNNALVIQSVRNLASTLLSLKRITGMGFGPALSLTI